MFFADMIMVLFTLILTVGSFFAFDFIILNGYFAAKLRKRFDVESLK
jgi:hypothetical protein